MAGYLFLYAPLLNTPGRHDYRKLQLAKARQGISTNSKPARKTHRSTKESNPEEVIRATEKMAMAAFSSGLKLVAAFGAAAAKSASLALESLASGAGKFSELVTKETLRPRGNLSITRTPQNNTVRRTRRKRAR